MLKAGTVFVLGAAVSNELGLPLGSDLRAKIRAMLPTGPNSYPDRVGALVECLYGVAGERWAEHARQLQQALPLAASIDNLVEHRHDDAEFRDVAKLTIAAVIAAAERAADFGKAATLNRLFQLMVAGVSRNRMVEAFGRATFITFNYDGTLRTFMERAVAAYSGLSETKAREFVEANLRVHHVYGALGRLPPGLDSRGGEWPQHLRAMAGGLRTFSEEMGSEEQKTLQDIVRNASQVIILGCAYHPRNFQLLDPGGAKFTRLFATQYVFVPPDPFDGSKPPMADFAAPAIETFRRVAKQWRNPDGHPMRGGAHYQVEPLSCLQMVEKHGPSWLDLAPPENPPETPEKNVNVTGGQSPVGS